MNDEIALLKELYSLSSKHSNYQLLSERLSNIINDNEIEIKSRYEKERLKYILDKIEIKDRTILDIGGNTGYFTFEMIDRGVSKVQYYEGNDIHSKFVEIASTVLNVNEKIKITRKYFNFDKDDLNEQFDIVLLLNILHHVGDDFGDKEITIEKAKDLIVEYLNNLSKVTNIAVIQFGFNWKGNKNLCLFENGLKSEMIDFMLKGTKESWEVLNIGVAESKNNKICYRDLNNNNINRFDGLGEFLNRPIFIMKSLGDC